MCGPMLALIGGVMGAAGSIVQGMGASAQYKAQAASYKAQALFNKRQAQAEYYKGSTEVLQQKRNVQRIQGAQEAGYAARGVTGEGSPLETAMSTETEAEMDRQAIRFGRDLTSSNYRYKAEIDLMNAEQSKVAAKYAMMSGFLGAGTALVGGFQNAFPTA